MAQNKVSDPQKLKFVFYFVYKPKQLFAILGEWLPVRVITSLMGFLSVVMSYSMRTCLSLAITEMVVPIVNTDYGNKSIVCDVNYLPTVYDLDRNNGNANQVSSTFTN